MAPPSRTVPFRIVVWQLSAATVVAVALFLWEFQGMSADSRLFGLEQTLSALAAGMASVIPAGLYAWRASVERSATSFLLQGFVKFGLTLVLMAAGIILVKPAAAGFFGTLILLQMMYVVVPLTVDRSGQT